MADTRAPSWDLIGPDENGLVVIEWRGYSSPTITGLPLGQVGDVAIRLADFLERVGLPEEARDQPRVQHRPLEKPE
jgi:hypothetical protein